MGGINYACNNVFKYRSKGQCYKTFQFSMLQIVNVCNPLVFVPGRPFQLSLMFEGKARKIPLSGAPSRCFTRVSPGLTRKH
jgi:hypothetical protein